MKAGVKKIEELDGKVLLKKDELEGLKGKLYILDPENSEIAVALEITEKGVFSIRLR